MGRATKEAAARVVELDREGREVLSAGSAGHALADWFRRRQRDAAGLHARTADAASRSWSFLDRDSLGTGILGEVVVLLHGFAADKDVWTTIAPLFPADRYRLIAPDLPGFGESGRRPDQPHDVRVQATRMLAFLDALRVHKPVHLVGHSMGGNVAARLAVDAGDRVASLTLISALGVVPRRLSATQQLVLDGRNPLLPRTHADYDRFLELAFASPPEPLRHRFVRRYLADRAIADAAFNARVFDDLNRHPDWLEPEDLAEITVPTLVIWGEADRVIDVTAVEKWTAGISGSRAVVIRGVGHAPMLEAPELTAQHIRHFLAAHSTSPSSHSTSPSSRA